MGYKIKSEDEENRLIAQWQDWKKEVRVCAAFEIKQKMKEEALQITQDGQFVTPTVNGYKVSKFLDIKKWWAMAPADCHKSEATVKITLILSLIRAMRRLSGSRYLLWF